MDVNIMKIEGNWVDGMVLDWHIANSEYLGLNQFGHSKFNTQRTQVGEAIYQLKYKSDFTQIDSLAVTMVNAIKERFPTIPLVVPMPPSKLRSTQPLITLAGKVAELLNVPFFQNILLKNEDTPQISSVPLKIE